MVKQNSQTVTLKTAYASYRISPKRKLMVQQDPGLIQVDKHRLKQK